MRALLIIFWLLLLVPAGAQTFPVEVKVRPPGLCPGCDCPADNCYTAACDCTLPVTDAWAAGTLERIVGILQRAYPAQMGERVPVTLKTATSGELGYTGMEQNYGIYDKGVLRVSREITRRQAAATLAHEYGHAWHFANHPDVEHMTEGLVEGFAEWVAFQVLKRMGDPAGADTIRTNADPIYGAGFRWFAEMERAQGAAAVWNVALNWLDLVGTRVARAPERVPVEPLVDETPAAEVVNVPRTPTRTGGFWVSPKGEPTP